MASISSLNCSGILVGTRSPSLSNTEYSRLITPKQMTRRTIVIKWTSVNSTILTIAILTFLRNVRMRKTSLISHRKILIDPKVFCYNTWAVRQELFTWMELVRVGEVGNCIHCKTDQVRSQMHPGQTSHLFVMSRFTTDYLLIQYVWL